MKKIYYLLFIVLAVFASSCTDDFEDWNTDDKNPAEVAGNALFTNAEKALSDQLSTPNVNLNNWSLWSQYWTETTYTDEANFDIVNRNVPQNVFRIFYRRVLKDLDDAAKLIAEEEGVEELATKGNRLHIIEMLNVYCYSRLVDIFGMVPYTDAMDIDNVYPSYDDGAAIYADLFTRLDAAISGLASGGDSFGSADLFYNGDAVSWVKFGNTLKIKMAIVTADANSAASKTAVEAAVAGAFTSSADDCLMPYLTSSPNFNPIYDNLVASGRDDYVPTNTLVDIMNGLDDPRRDNYFTLIDTSATGAGDYIYLGGDYGESSAFANYSHVSAPVQEASFKGIILTYNELLFYLAEAAERGYSVGDAEDLYIDAITESILWWGGTQTEVDTYLAQPEVDYTTALAASSATYPWREVIGTQSWIASYINGFVGWTTYRRLDYPAFNMPPTPYNDITEVPTRFTFPINEQTLNAVNYATAASAVGGDELVTKIFWDIY